MTVPDGDGVAIAGVRLTSPDRVLFSELGLTKEALARFYDSVAEWILPDLKNRPLSLVRCPQGPEEGCFFQKHIDNAWSDEIERASVPESDGVGIYAVANSPAALVGLVQKGVIELHVMGAATRALDKPDRMVFDLDPGPGLAWRDVIAAARLTRDVLDDAGLESFLKTSGGKGLHVVVPLAPRHDWDEVKAFSRAVAEKLAGDDPHRFTAKMAKRERVGRIRAHDEQARHGGFHGAHERPPRRESRIFTNDRLRSSSSVRPLFSTASCSVIAPQFIARRK